MNVRGKEPVVGSEITVLSPHTDMRTNVAPAILPAVGPPSA